MNIAVIVATVALLVTTPAAPAGCATDAATLLAGTIYAEARGEAVAGQVAVAWVVRNRVESAVTWWGTDYETVLSMPYQFATADATTPDLCAIAEGVMAGDVADNTDGATHFHAATVSPDWPGLVTVARIGKHVFLKRGR